MRKIYLSIILLALFSIGTGSLSAQFTESFDASIPGSWTVTDNDGQGETWVHYTSFPYQGSGGLRIHWETNAHDDYLITPQFMVTANTSDRIRFYAGGTGTTFPETFDVKLSTTGTNPGDFTVTLGSETTQVDAEAGVYEEFTYDIPAMYQGQNIYIAVVATSTDEFYLYLDEFSVEAIPACANPSALAATNITTTSADLEWTDNSGGSAVGFEIELGTAGFSPTGTATHTSATSPLNVATLTASTTYDFYVRSDCGSGDFSNWVGPYQFTTPCNSFTVPWSDSFEANTQGGGSTTQPNCWAWENGDFVIGEDGVTASSYNRAARTGSKFVYISYGSDDWMMSPGIDLTAGNNYAFSFWVVTDGATGFDLEVGVNTSQSSTGITVLGSESDIVNETYEEKLFYFTPSSTGTYYFGVHATGNFTPWYMSFDDFNVVQAPSCLPPVSLNTTNVTGNSADLGWTEQNGAGTWDIEWGSAGFTQGTGTMITGTTTNPHNLTGLSPTTDYDFYVRTDCGGGDMSTWAGPFTFSTGQIPVSTFPYSQDWESGQGGWEIANGTETNTWNIGSAVSNGGNQSMYVSNTNGATHTYDNTSTSTVHTYRDFSIPAGNTYIALSFDWIADAESCCDELRVFLAPTSFSPSDGVEISTSGTAPTGIIQLGGSLNIQNSFITESFLLDQSYAGQTFRLIFQWHNDGSAGTNPPAAVDNINIEIATCGVPSNLSSSNVTTTTADIDWDPFGTEPEWNVLYGPAGFAIGSGTSWDVSVSSDTTLDNLTQFTEYDVYVQAECGSNDTSNWVGPITFTTDPTCPEPIAFQITGTTASSVDLQWNPQGVETSWNVEYGPAGFTPGTGTGTVENVNTNTPTISGLQPGVVYEFYVEADCSGTTNPFAGPVTYSTPIVNDAACDAVQIQVDGSTTQYTNAGATLETGELTSLGDNTVWFMFDAPASGHVEIKTCGNDFDNFVEVYELTDCADFGTFTLVDAATDNPFASCSGTVDPAGLNLCGLTSGNTYYLAVGSETAGNTGIFPLTLTEIPLVDAGTGTTSQVCSGDTVNLANAVTGGDTGGVWTELDMSGGLLPGGMFSTNNLAYTSYRVQYKVENVCDADSSNVTVAISGPSQAGQDGTLTDCNVLTDFYLFDGLSGTVDFGGTWSDVDGTGKLNGSVFSPDSLAAGTYQFDYITSNGVCPNDTSTVEVTIQDCLGTEEFTAESFKIFPNPTQGIFYIVSTVNAQDAVVEITDLQGKVISSRQMNINAGAQYDFDLSQLERGVYLIKMATEDNTSVKRVVLQR